MPHDWVPPEIAIRLPHLTIYHVYKDDWRQNGAREYLFVTNKLLGESDSFDIRDWPKYVSEHTAIENLFRAADSGDITEDGPSWE